MTTHTLAAPALKPFPGFSALDGCHCVTSSLARIFCHSGHPLSEEMLLGRFQAGDNILADLDETNTVVFIKQDVGSAPSKELAEAK